MVVTRAVRMMDEQQNSSTTSIATTMTGPTLNFVNSESKNPTIASGSEMKKEIPATVAAEATAAEHGGGKKSNSSQPSGMLLRGQKLSTSAPVPPPVRYNKPPIYTSDKRARFTNRENKKWIRLATVTGYLMSVCMPAIALSIYYIGFWDPKYDLKVLIKNGTDHSSTTLPPLPSSTQDNNNSNLLDPTVTHHANSGDIESGTKIKRDLSSHPVVAPSTHQRVIVNIENENIESAEKYKNQLFTQNDDENNGKCWCKVEKEQPKMFEKQQSQKSAISEIKENLEHFKKSGLFSASSSGSSSTEAV